METATVATEKKRTRIANAFLWACIGELAKHDCREPRAVYEDLIFKYGVTFVATASAMRTLTRYFDHIRDADDGRIIVATGSSGYTAAEFSALLSGTLSEMKDRGLKIAPDERTRRMLADWRKTHEQR